jgi:RNA polymerase sigma-70 factor (ECF subfamily)
LSPPLLDRRAVANPLARRLEQWREEAAFSTWLFAVALSVFRSAIQRRNVKRETPLEEGSEAVASGNVLDDVAARYEHELVRRTVRSLPRRYRDAIILFYFLDQNVIDAAGVLGVPEGTLKARLHRGRALLKVRLSRRLENRPARDA